MKAPTIFIISGPSGAGKTTLLNQLLRQSQIRKKFMRAISFTTRQRRPREKNKKDYIFISKGDFLKLKKNNFFLEWQKVLDNYYGTPKYFYTQAAKDNKDLILCIDVKGGMYLKKKHKIGKIVTIFVSAPNKKELFKRLQKRIEKEDSIFKRLSLAKTELKFCRYYDYAITNSDIKDSVAKLRDILLANNKGG
jgi:guanylate kinase